MSLHNRDSNQDVRRSADVVQHVKGLKVVEKSRQQLNYIQQNQQAPANGIMKAKDPYYSNSNTMD